MTKLRRQLQRELALRGRSPRTQESYERAVSGLAAYYDRSTDRIKDDEIKDYLLYLIQQRDLSAGSMNVYVSGLRFFYQKVLNRSIAEVEASLPRPRRPVRRPRVFSEEERRSGGLSPMPGGQGEGRVRESTECTVPLGTDQCVLMSQGMEHGWAPRHQAPERGSGGNRDFGGNGAGASHKEGFNEMSLWKLQQVNAV